MTKSRFSGGRGVIGSDDKQKARDPIGVGEGQFLGNLTAHAQP